MAGLALEYARALPPPARFGAAAGYQGVVALEDPDAGACNAHDRASRAELVRRAAALLDAPVLDRAGPIAADARVLAVPGETIEWAQAAAAGIVAPEMLLGGVVPRCFVGTKSIVHPLAHGQAARPEGWSDAVAALMPGAALRGAACFSRADAMRAGEALLADGPVRLKEVRAKAGLGQQVIRDLHALDAALAAMDPRELADFGVVLEENLADVETFSVGATMLGPHRIAYWGEQRLTRDHRGREVYGGTELTAVRGGFAELAALPLPPVLARAVACAAAFDAAARAGYPELMVTRCNYDVIRGLDAGGQERVAVLEQSWRVGGASPAELEAMAALAGTPALAAVRCASVEVYDDVGPPAGAAVYFRGTDPVVGPMTKYAVRLA